MTHLKPAEIIDAAEGYASAARQQHLETCAQCREQVKDLAGVLEKVKVVPAREPSPLFWDHLSANIRERVAQQRLPVRARAWIWAPAAVAVTVAVAIGVSNTWLTERPETTRVGSTERPASTQQGTVQDGSWGVVSQASDELGWEEVEAAGLAVPPGAADYAAAELSDEQQVELARLLQQELARLKS